jgi:hypothetical protein
MTAGPPASVTTASPQAGSAAPVGLEPRLAMGRRRWLVLAGCALLGTTIGTAGEHLTAPGSTPVVAASKPPPSPAATVVSSKIIPVSVKDSSFTQRDGAWKSQTYADEYFGNLKKGIGLLLDLETARPLTAVTFNAETGPLTVELRAGDNFASDGSAYRLVGTPVQANGATRLPASAGGSHRFWMIWVTKLPPSCQARISNPVAHG